MDELAEIRAQEKELRLRRFRLEGKLGICSKCGKEGMYADEEQTCCKCYAVEEARKVRRKYNYLIGMTVSDIIPGDLKDIQGLTLSHPDRQDIRLEIEMDWDGDARLEVAKPINTVHA